jgi:hypothetical protein
MITFSKQVRDYVLDVHGTTCHVCKGAVDSTDLSIDHLIPVAIGGTDELDNLRPVHRSCNSAKGKYSLDDPGTLNYSRRWDEASVIAEIRRRRGDEIADRATKLLSWACCRGLKIEPSQRNRAGGLYVWTTHLSRNVVPFAIWGSGAVWLHFPGKYQPGIAATEEFANLEQRIAVVANLVRSVPQTARLRGISNVYEAATKNPEVDLYFLLSDEGFAGFTAVYDDVLRRIGAISS